MQMGSYVHLNETVDGNTINQGAMKILSQIRQEWPSEKIRFKLLTDGITNKLVACSLVGGKEDDVVLIRIYGNKTDLLIDRTLEKRNILMLNKVGLSSRLYASFKNGLAYEYIPGRTLTDETVIQPEIYKLVATHMARLHKVNTDNAPPFIWNKIQKFLNLVPNTFTDPSKQARYESLLVKKHDIQNEISLLRDKLSKLGSPIVFAHNDLLLGNVIYTEEKNKVSFIDFEYAAPNYQAFDIGNHFCEFVGIKDVDYSKYPTEKIQKKWLRTYLEKFYTTDSENSCQVTDDEVEILYVQVNQFALLAHLFWAVWALIQAEFSYIDYDFIEYAEIRVTEYFAKKEQFLSLQLP